MGTSRTTAGVGPGRAGRAATVTVRVAACVLLGGTLAWATAGPAVLPVAHLTASAAQAPRVKYYVVAAAYEGRPETLTTIATRLLGSPSLAARLLALNAGRVQPDGATLTDPDALRAGWVLVLPWDAVGPGVELGELPTGPAPAIPPSAAPSTGATSTGTASAGPVVASPAPGACAGTPRAAAGAQQWAQLRLAPQRAWLRSRGDGVMVGVVDSGVDSSLPQLAGRVADGADVVTGTGRGNVDCIGTGTAMAGLIAAQADSGGGLVGIAPGASILPVRVVVDAPRAALSDQAVAIDVAVSAGVRVLAIGSYVDLSDAAVQAAIGRAVGRNVVVVVGAAGAGGGALAGVLRVGAVSIDGQLGASYPPGAVDVVAPGVDITSLGISGTGTFTGSGTHYAVAFVAAQAALVRSVDPALAASAVTEQIRQTASRIGGTAVPDPAYGWGMIDLGQALADLPRPTAAPVLPASGPAVPMMALVITAVAAAVILLLLVLRIRRAVRTGPAGPPGWPEGDPTGPGPAEPVAPGALAGGTGARMLRPPTQGVAGPVGAVPPGAGRAGTTEATSTVELGSASSYQKVAPSGRSGG